MKERMYKIIKVFGEGMSPQYQFVKRWSCDSRGPTFRPSGQQGQILLNIYIALFRASVSLQLLLTPLLTTLVHLIWSDPHHIDFPYWYHPHLLDLELSSSSLALAFIFNHIIVSFHLGFLSKTPQGSLTHFRLVFSWHKNIVSFHGTISVA